MELATIPQAFGLVFEETKYKLLTVLLSFLFFFIYVSTPIFLLPGNRYSFFLSFTPWTELLATALLSVLVAVVFTMQIYSWRNKIAMAKNTGVGIISFFSASLSTIFSSATCASCVSAIFSFLGFGGVVFLIQHKTEIIGLTFIMVLASLYFTSGKIVGNCSSCNVSCEEKIMKR